MASLGGLVTGVAHELNTPLGVGITSLSSIKLIIEQVQSSLASGDISKSELGNALETVSELEQLADKNLYRMVKLIQQFKYISVDQDIEISKSFALSSTLDDLMTIWKTALKNKNLTLNIDIEKGIKLL